jgi:hypothetical protein
LNLQPKENLVVVADKDRDPAILEAVRLTAMEADGEVTTIVLSQHKSVERGVLGE